jgi:hypothetical protein
MKELLGGNIEPDRLKSMLESIERHQEAYQNRLHTN